jgi:predicted transcriptional regulator
MNSHTINEIFAILHNPTRRRILRLLAMERHYPLQIARELGLSQQAVGKHIRILEDHGLIRSFDEPSSMGGPPRKSYVPTQRISMRIDLGPGVFRTSFTERRPKHIRPPHPTTDRTDRVEYSGGSTSTPPPPTGDSATEGEPGSERKTKTKPSSEKGDGGTIDRDRLQRISREIQEVSGELEKLERKRVKLVNRRAELMEEGREIVKGTIPDYLERRLVYHLLEQGPTSMEDMSEIMDRRIKLLHQTRRDIEERYGLKWLFRP